METPWPPLWIMALSPAILAISSLTALVALFLSLRNSREKRRLDTVLRIMDSEQSKRYSEIHEAFTRAKKSGKLLNLSDPRSGPEWEEREKVFMYLNHYELIGMGIKRGLLSYRVYLDWMGSVVVRTWNDAHEFIDLERCASGASTIEAIQNNQSEAPQYNQRLYENLQYLAERFAADLKLDCKPLDKDCSKFLSPPEPVIVPVIE